MPSGERRKRNTVRRQLLRAISLLMRHYVGAAERDRIFADVDFPAVDDTREVFLTSAEIVRLVEACEEAGSYELGVLVRLAIQTSADRGVLLAGSAPHGKVCRGLLVRDLEIYQLKGGTFEGEVFLMDGKTKRRTRTVRLTDGLCRELLVLCKGKGPEDRVFNMKYAEMDYPWQQARVKAKLEHVHFKDLRSQFSIYAEKAGVPLTVVSNTMGHDSEEMTRRYQQHRL